MKASEAAHPIEPVLFFRLDINIAGAIAPPAGAG
jgi:hypothetical protein